tara:strand:- start:11 stop:445 length:435 start_codon:yes stop_codon:yes gene_type:complete
MTDIYHIFKGQFSNMIYIRENNKFGNLVLVVKNFNITTLKNKFDLLVEFIYYSCLEALKISNNYNNKTFTAHIYLEQASMKNFSLKLFKKINKKLAENLKDVLDICYIYGSGAFLLNIFKLLRSLLDRDVRKKIVIVKQKYKKI